MKSTYTKKCTVCKEPKYILAHDKDIQSFLEGAHAQQVLPYLSPADRELLISGTCGDCWTKLFGNAADDEKCQICEIPIEEGFSLCNPCSDQVDYWNEDKDYYRMKDGRILRWSSKAEKYE